VDSLIILAVAFLVAAAISLGGAVRFKARRALIEAAVFGVLGALCLGLVLTRGWQ
jgi:hypothetical protein